MRNSAEHLNGSRILIGEYLKILFFGSFSAQDHFEIHSTLIGSHDSLAKGHQVSFILKDADIDELNGIFGTRPLPLLISRGELFEIYTRRPRSPQLLRGDAQQVCHALCD